MKKLRNKKTNDIIDLNEWTIQSGYLYITISNDNDSTLFYKYESLAELNKEWEDEPDEEWRDVLGFEELYQVSNLGNVRTVKRGEATEMAQEEHWNGYLSVHLRNKGVERRASVHRLVAEAFIPNPDGLRDVNHKNGIKTDNRVENLEWLSHSDNIKHMYKMKEPKEPLIKDEKVQKAIRVFCEVTQEKKRILVIKQFGRGSAEFSVGGRYAIRLPLSYESMDALEDGRNYTLTELCGEEE